MAKRQEQPHSFEVINDGRYGWWNLDYLELLLKRVGFDRVRSLAEIGIGGGHWASLLAQTAKRPLKITGVDNEPYWLEEARKKFEGIEGGHKLKLIGCDAHKLEIPDSCFDFVTCQTVLMHCQHPEQALSEMVRIAKPGAWVFVVEPINLFNRAQIADSVCHLNPRDRAAIYHFWSAYHQGQKRKRHVDHDIALNLPDLFAGAGLEQISMFQNDRVIITPAAHINYSEHINEYLKEKVISLSVAGGATSAELNRAKSLANLIEKRVHKKGGYVAETLNMFIAIGRKPK